MQFSFRSQRPLGALFCAAHRLRRSKFLFDTSGSFHLDRHELVWRGEKSTLPYSTGLELATLTIFVCTHPFSQSGMYWRITDPLQRSVAPVAPIFDRKKSRSSGQSDSSVHRSLPPSAKSATIVGPTRQKQPTLSTTLGTHTSTRLDRTRTEGFAAYGSHLMFCMFHWRFLKDPSQGLFRILLESSKVLWGSPASSARS